MVEAQRQTSDIELQRLMKDLSDDPEVGARLDGLSMLAAPEGTTVMYRDWEDVLTISRMTVSILVIVPLLFLSLAFNLILYLRKPDMVVVDKTSGRALMVNNRYYGETEAVQLGPERLTQKDKEYAVRQWLEALYTVDQATRPAQINKLLRMMVPDSSVQFAKYLKENQFLEIEAQQSVQSTWEVQRLDFDEKDPYLCRVTGERFIRKIVNGSPMQQRVQLIVKILLSASNTNPKRNDNNLRTGFYVLKYKAQSVKEEPLEPIVLLADPAVANTTNNGVEVRK